MNFIKTSFKSEAAFSGLFGTWSIPGDESDHAQVSQRWKTEVTVCKHKPLQKTFLMPLKLKPVNK